MRDQKECSAVHFVGAPDIPTFQRGRAWYAQFYEHHISTILYYTILYYTAVYNQVPLQCARLAGRRILGFGVPVHKSDSSICGTKNKVVGVVVYGVADRPLRGGAKGRRNLLILEGIVNEGISRHPHKGHIMCVPGFV